MATEPEQVRCPVRADFDPLDAAFLEDPYAVLASLPVAEEPVFYAPALDYYVVTRYADVEAVFLDPRSYSAATAQLPLVPLVPAAREILAAGGHRPQPSMVSLDPPAHTRLAARRRAPSRRGGSRRWRSGSGPPWTSCSTPSIRPRRSTSCRAHLPAPGEHRVLVHGRAGSRLAAAEGVVRPPRDAGLGRPAPDEQVEHAESMAPTAGTCASSSRPRRTRAATTTRARCWPSTTRTRRRSPTRRSRPSSSR
jgi:hypothetical protein